MGTLPPDEARARATDLTNEAFREYWGRDLDHVIDLCTRAIDADPEYPWPYSMRGAAYTAKGLFPNALLDLNRALELAPDFTPALTNRALTYLRMGLLDPARADLEAALFLTPTDVVALATRAEVEAASGQPEAACESLIEAVENGFRDIRIVEDRRVFEGLLFSDCYDRLQQLVFVRSGGVDLMDRRAGRPESGPGE
jgi:tetratricopeptide (TPR) repeat protein